ncbi:MAG: acetyl-CoA C-acetyltransferase [Gammaproteobacteria bacterium]|nr:acetyl-CoA C-acetyltransferase [Gammaproteobacteria bacterium]
MPKRKLKPAYARDVYIVDGSRTPFLKARGKPGPFSASDLAVSTGQHLLARQPFSAAEFDEVIVGCMSPSENEANIARIIGLRLGTGKKVPGFTVQRNCASGLQSIDSGALLIGSGRAELILAGGTEAMSRSPLLFNRKMTNWFADFQAAKNISDKLKTLSHFRPSYLMPIISLLSGLTDPIVGLNMGQTAEILASRFNISRQEMDEYAARSHHRLANAFDQQWMQEVTALYDEMGHVYLEDDGLRRDTSVEKLAALKPFFDKKFGLVTAGNSSQITDGAALVILASATAVKKYDLPVLGKILDIQWAGVDPAQMGLGPVHAITPILERQNLLFDDIDYVEINEAFAAQVLACLKAWESDKYCTEKLGLRKSLGTLDQNKLNIDGGAIAAGHPIGASGARVTLHLLNILKRTNTKLGIASLCVGGGIGGAILIENTSEANS